MVGIYLLGKYDEVAAVPASARNDHPGKSEKESCVGNFLCPVVLTEVVAVKVHAEFCQFWKSWKGSNTFQLRLYFIREPFRL